MKSIQRCMACVAGTVVVCTGLFAVPARAKEPDTKAMLLPYRVLNVFQEHCLKCHGDAAPKGGVRILNHALLVEQRKLIRPKSPNTSELIDLVEGGSMPPGTRPKVPKEDLQLLEDWVRAGAEALPDTYDESYVLWSIVCDLRKLTKEQQRSKRYLSLNHLLARENAAGNLAKQRQKLERVLRDLMPDGKQAPPLSSIEKTDTIFRIDLKDLGWDRPPYPKKGQPWRKLNLFDLILLEYPNGRLLSGSPFYDSGLLHFLLVLQDAGQVRPIPYLRADWLVDEAIGSPQSALREDIRSVLGKPKSKSIQNGAAQPGPFGDVEIAAARSRGERPPRSPLSRGESFPALERSNIPDDLDKKRSIVSDERLAEQLRHGAKRIVPLDGLIDSPQFKFSSDIEFKAIDFKNLKLDNPPAKNLFYDGDEMALCIKTNWNPVIEVIKTDKDGRKEVWPLKLDNSEWEVGKAYPITDKNKPIRMRLVKKDVQEMEEFTLYAYPFEELEATNSVFPKGTLLQAAGIRDRVVHPFYQLGDDGQVKPPHPHKMVKLTFSITIRPSKSK